MESTAQDWRPVWEAPERYWRSKRGLRTDASPLSAGTAGIESSSRFAATRKAITVSEFSLLSYPREKFEPSPVDLYCRVGQVECAYISHGNDLQKNA